MYRISKAISRLGIATRRQADNLILQKKVILNGKSIEDFSVTVNIGDTIIVDKKVYKFHPKPAMLFAFYKPKGCITSKSDSNNRVTIYDVLPSKYNNLITIGRLDYNTEGLLLLTNDGELARFMELPSSKFERIYKVRAFGFLDAKKLHHIMEKSFHDLRIDGIDYGKVIVKYDGHLKDIDRGRKNHHFKIKIYEGKNREIRNIMNFFGFEVNRLIRDRFGDYSIQDINQKDVTQLVMKKDLLKKFQIYLSGV